MAMIRIGSVRFILMLSRMILSRAGHKFGLVNHCVVTSSCVIAGSHCKKDSHYQKDNPGRKKDEKTFPRFPPEDILFVFNNYMSHFINY